MTSISISCPHPFLFPDVPPFPEGAGRLSPGPTHFTPADGGGGTGWAGPPLPSHPEDRVSVYNIYMYVLFPVLYGPCPLSIRLST